MTWCSLKIGVKNLADGDADIHKCADGKPRRFVKGRG